MFHSYWFGIHIGVNHVLFSFINSNIACVIFRTDICPYTYIYIQINASAIKLKIPFPFNVQQINGFQKHSECAKSQSIVWDFEFYRNYPQHFNSFFHFNLIFINKIEHKIETNQKWKSEIPSVFWYRESDNNLWHISNDNYKTNFAQLFPVVF